MNRLSVLRSRAQASLKALAHNPYPGRGLVIGLNASGTCLVQVAWIMGRSDDSRNRVYVEPEPGVVRTAIADPSRPAKDPKLTIYNAMREWPPVYDVSNGHQTDAVKGYSDLFRELRHWTYEPDPNSTARISARAELTDADACAEIVVIRKALHDDGCERHLFTYPSLPKGIGWCVHTYMGDGSPLPTFTGEPIPLPLASDADAIAKQLWQTLNPDNRVSLVVKLVNVKTGKVKIKIINKYRKVG